MKKPRLLDLFCGAGGAAWGYHLAGFEVVGVDNRPQKRYPFRFVLGDALAYLETHGHEFDVIHTSPPCQAYCALRHMAKKAHPQLIEPTREGLQASGKPYVIENVPGAPLMEPLILCGSMFGLQTTCGAQLRRHRLFESNVFLMSPGECRHADRTVGVAGHEFRNEATRYAQRVISVTGDHPHSPAARKANCARRAARTISITGKVAENPVFAYHGRRRTISITGNTPQQNVVRNVTRETFSIEEARTAMGIPWMVMAELSQAIPPAYTEFIGHQLMEHLR